MGLVRLNSDLWHIPDITRNQSVHSPILAHFIVLFYTDIDQRFAEFIYSTVPTYLDRLKNILTADLPRYTDLPQRERLFIQDMDSFSRVRDVNPAMVASHIPGGFLKLSENDVQLALEAILNIPHHKIDWGGEFCDLFTANMTVNGARRVATFLLKGPGIGRKEMTIADCGANGDQIIRLFMVPADLFVIQSVGPIAELVVADAQGKVNELRARGRDANFLIMDGQDTACLLHAYGKL